MRDYSITVKEQIDERLEKNLITKKEYNYLINEIDNITTICMKDLKINTKISEELAIINRTITNMLQEMPNCNEEGGDNKL